MENIDAENIRQYGNLTEQELFDFLAEIKNVDEDIQEAQDDADKNIALEEEQSDIDDTNELREDAENLEIEARYGEDAWRSLQYGSAVLYSPETRLKSKENVVAAVKARNNRLRLERLQIQREAFRQEYIRLSDEVGNDKIKLLLSLLVQSHTIMIDKYIEYINRRLAMLLNPFIPRKLVSCKKLYPNSVRVSPGFLYRASAEYGGGLTFWATPNIPYYFAQNTEQKVLIEHKAPFLFNIDRAVKLYHEHSIKRSEKELRYASLIYKKKVKTYFDLLRLNPFWYDALYKDLVNKINSIL